MSDAMNQLLKRYNPIVLSNQITIKTKLTFECESDKHSHSKATIRSKKRI